MSKELITRRKALKSISAFAGVSTLGVPASAKSADETEVGNSTYARCRVVYELASDNVRKSEVNAIRLLAPDEVNNRLYILSQDKNLINRLASQDSIIDDATIQEAPCKVYTGRESTEVPTQLTGGVPAETAIIDKKPPIPTGHLSLTDDNRVHLKLQGKTETVQPNRAAEIRLRQFDARQKSQRERLLTKITPKLIVENFGDMTLITGHDPAQ